jgi:hypothetical protein
MYVSAIHSDPAAVHMHIPIILHFPGHSSIQTLAFLDSRAQMSLIREHFVSKHSLGRHLLDNPLLLKSYNGSASNTVTQGVLTDLLTCQTQILWCRMHASQSHPGYRLATTT